MNDSYSHMLIARRVFDNLTPGIAQLGGIWLPLPHLLMMPFIWNDYLWQTGLAGSFSTMPCYVFAAIYLFLAARRLTHNSRASFVGTLLFVLNPNILYLQTTPLGELVYIATLTMASYYFLAWAQEEKLNYLILSAASTFLATLTRYDGWAIFIVFLICIPLIGAIKGQNRSLIEANSLLFGILGGLGIVLWILWNTIIFHDPLYFQHSEFSSQAQQKTLPTQLQYLHTKILITYHELWQSIHSYSLDAIYNVGLILFTLALIAVIIFFFRRRVTSEMVAASIFLVPFPFYVFALYTAQAVIFVPGAAPAHAPVNITFYNVRYGVEIVAPAAVFIATLANWQRVRHFLKERGQLIFQLILSLTIIVQTFIIAYGGIITLQDSQYGLDCALLHPVVVYLVQHYDGGRIMEDTFTSTTSLPSEVGVDFKDIVYEGSGDLWKQALQDPSSEVSWILANPTNAGDLVAQHIDVTNQQFLSEFTPVVQQGDGLILFHHNGLRPLPTKSITPGLLTAHRLCNIGKFLPL